MLLVEENKKTRKGSHFSLLKETKKPGKILFFFLLKETKDRNDSIFFKEKRQDKFSFLTLKGECQKKIKAFNLVLSIGPRTGLHFPIQKIKSFFIVIVLMLNVRTDWSHFAPPRNQIGIRI